MQVFVSWSGQRSGRLAEALKRWLDGVIDGLELFISTELVKGSLWFGQVEEALDVAGGGLICVTPENVGSPWVHYELGALARGLGGEAAKIYTFLLDVRPEDIKGPMSEYQHTLPNHEDVKRLVASIAGDAAADQEWERRFEDAWPGLEKEIEEVRQRSLTEVLPDFERLFNRKTFNEPFQDCSDQNWLDRYNAARDTFAILKDHEQAVERGCSPSVYDWYHGLVNQMDGYVMDIRAYLLTEVRCDPPDALRDSPCERRRQNIARLVGQLAAG